MFTILPVFRAEFRFWRKIDLRNRIKTRFFAIAARPCPAN